MTTDSPYDGLRENQWLEKTEELVAAHPLDRGQIVDVVLSAWNSIFSLKVNPRGFRIGVELRPKPQIMGFFLHELIPLELSARAPKNWRGDKTASEKDLVYIPNDAFSVEIKTSSNKSRIFGNRSYAQKSSADKKAKSGYYLAVNFESFESAGRRRPEILLVRFGWIDSRDWIGQAAATGQQARLPSSVETSKLLTLYSSRQLE